MRKLEIDWGELTVAFESGLAEMEYYLDLETGEVLMITEEIRWYMEEPLDAELLGWQQEMLQIAQRIEAGYGTRYIQIPEQERRDAYRDMEWFITTVADQALQDELWRAIQGRGAFRRFKDLLQNHPEERERWFSFKEHRVQERLMEWLEGEGIEPTNPIERSDGPEP